jgi:hypothetical protein
MTMNVARCWVGIAIAAVSSISVSAQQPRPQPPGDGVQVGVPRGSETDQQRDAEEQRRIAAQREQRAKRPVPRAADGHIVIGQTSKEKGVWLPGPVIPNPLGFTDIPYQPWTRALAADRRTHQLEPHARCKPSGVARQFFTPYGVEFLEVRELQRAYIFDIGGPQTYRTIYLDGRPRPKTLSPSYYGHSIGHWDGDTLVVDTIGFNEDFWLDRGMLPHTSQLHTIERFTRTSFDTLRYELTIDDPGAYTAPFSGRMDLKWEDGTELFEYVCQEANYAPTLMVGQGTSVDRSSAIVP